LKGAPCHCRLPADVNHGHEAEDGAPHGTATIDKAVAHDDWHARHHRDARIPHEPRPDVVVMDVSMPEMNGLKAAEALQGC
jgi:CheY-like chemotaxis protein